LSEPATIPVPKDIEERIRRNLGRVMLTARWIMAPIYLGLLSSSDAIFIVLTLVDLSLVANLVVIVMFAGWENFVGRLLASHADDRPDWLAVLDFSTVKLRLLGSIVAIAAIQILETFVHIDEVNIEDAAWQLAILIGIGVVGALLALTDRLSNGHGGK
jgi:uncharacterized protein (TIGR00645 family)